MTKIMTMMLVLALLIALEHIFFVLHLKKELLQAHDYSSHSLLRLIKGDFLEGPGPNRNTPSDALLLEQKLHQYHTAQSTNFERYIDDTIFINILRDLFILILFLVMLLVMTYRALRPIRTLTKAIAEINTGNFDYDWDIRTADELAFMSESINVMRQNLKRIASSRQELNKEIAERRKMEQKLIEEKHNLEVFQKAAVDQEMHIIKLKKTVNKYMIENGLAPKYRMSEDIEL